MVNSTKRISLEFFELFSVLVNIEIEIFLAMTEKVDLINGSMAVVRLFRLIKGIEKNTLICPKNWYLPKKSDKTEPWKITAITIPPMKLLWPELFHPGLDMSMHYSGTSFQRERVGGISLLQAWHESIF